MNDKVFWGVRSITGCGDLYWLFRNVSDINQAYRYRQEHALIYSQELWVEEYKDG